MMEQRRKNTNTEKIIAQLNRGYAFRTCKLLDRARVRKARA